MRTHDAKHLRTAPRGTRGFSILEIVIALIIISILTLALMPTVTNRARQARINVALTDARTIADAQERLSVDTGFFARLYVLDDVTDVGDGIRNDADADLIDGTNDEDLATTSDPGATLTSISTIWISTTTEDFQTGPAAVTDRFILDEEAFGWVGPYLNWNLDVNGNDWPDDPWGNDYLLVTKAGALFTPELVPGESVSDDEFQFPNFTTSTLWGGGTLDTSTFDRPAIISFGPDREPGDASLVLGDPLRLLGTGDDIVIFFGGG